MEDHQEFEKPVFEFRHTKLRSPRILRNCTTKKTKTRSMNLFCYYESHKSPPNRSKKKKSLIRCDECGKGFRYEKCLLNHREVTHSLNQKKIESSMSLLISFSDVQRRKRSKRVSRYKRVSSSSSFTVFPASVVDGELLEVAESLILLSKSGGKFLRFGGESPLDVNMRDEHRLVGEALDSNVRKAGEFEDGFLSNERELVRRSLDGEFGGGVMSKEKKFVGFSSETDGISKGFSGFLGDKKAMKVDESGQQKVVGAGSVRAVAEMERLSLEDRPGLMLQHAETDIEQRLACQESASEDSYSGSKGSPMNTEYRCRACDKVFSTYQALGGHQTFHRIRSKSVKSNQVMRRRISRC